MDFVDSCYLIKHSQGWLLWDTGWPTQSPPCPKVTPFRSRRDPLAPPKTLAAQLEQLGLKPSEIKYVGVSHSHPDHAGNVAMFPQSMLLVQKAEYDWPAPTGPRFKPELRVTKLEGDHDVFGDGSVTIISTPGHTPGHQSLLVKLAKTGAVLLSGDAVHFKENWDNRRVPDFNRQGADQRFDEAHGGHHRKGKRPTLDQSRQGAARRAKAVTRFLRVRQEKRVAPFFR